MDRRALASQVLKKLDAGWQLFSIPKSEDSASLLLGMWAKSLARVTYPDWVLVEAVDVLHATAKAGDSPPMPGDVIAAAKVVIDRASRDPNLAGELQAWRDRLRDQRDSCLERKNSAK